VSLARDQCATSPRPVARRLGAMSVNTDAVTRLYATIDAGKPDGRSAVADLVEIEELSRPGAR
jgi:hypothetical protein